MKGPPVEVTAHSEGRREVCRLQFPVTSVGPRGLSKGLSHSFTHNSPIHMSFETVVW